MPAILLFFFKKKSPSSFFDGASELALLFNISCGMQACIFQFINKSRHETVNISNMKICLFVGLCEFTQKLSGHQLISKGHDGVRR